MTSPALDDVFAALEAMHGSRRWHWDDTTAPFEVAVGCILVQNTAWTNAERAIDALRAAGALAPDSLAALGDDDIEALVRPSGQYRQKARKLRAFLDLCARVGGFDALLAMPMLELRACLLATWGIGPETADAVVLYCSRQPAFVIDAYTQRLFVRLALGPASSRYADWQAFFTTVLPPDAQLYARWHALIVQHAKYICRKSAPRCGECVLAHAARSRCHGQQMWPRDRAPSAHLAWRH